MNTDTCFRSYLAKFFSAEEMFRTKVVGEKNTRFMPNNFFLENLPVYEIMWGNITQPGRQQTTICRMRIACRIPKATDTHSEYVTLYLSTTTTVTQRA